MQVDMCCYFLTQLYHNNFGLVACGCQKLLTSLDAGLC